MTLSAAQSIESSRPVLKRVKCGGANPPPGFTCKTRFMQNCPHHIYHQRRCSKIAYQFRQLEKLREQIRQELKGDNNDPGSPKK